MRTIALVLAVAFLLPAVVAQDAEAHYKALMAKVDAANAAYTAAIRKVIATDAYKSALETYRSSTGAEKTAARDKLNALRAGIKRPALGAFAKEFVAAAEKYAGTDHAVPFLSWLSMRGPRDDRDAAIATVMSKHAGSAKIGDFLGFTPNFTRGALTKKEVREFCAKVIKDNEHAEMKAAAHYARARTFLGTGRNPDPMAGYEDAYKNDLAAIKALAPNSAIAKKAFAPEFEKTRLQVGMVAPDISGEDLDGVDFKLSDYRGKVVVIDFWGDW